MTRREPKDLSASIRQRLLTWSQHEQLDFQYVLTRYGIERLLYRLSCSAYRERFILKGAMLYVAWEGWSPRQTRDVDLLGRGNPNLFDWPTIITDICRLEVAPDGLIFDPETLQVADIRDDQAYGGQRLRLRAALGVARIDIQMDVGFGDSVFPRPEQLVFPVLLDLPAPTLLAYPRETVVAEKLHAMVSLGLANSRMKDFYDLWLLARQFAFTGTRLAGAIRATFERRQTELPTVAPVALTASFYAEPNKAVQWQAFLRRNQFDRDMTLSQIAQVLETFLMPPTLAAGRADTFTAHWLPGGPWRTG